MAIPALGGEGRGRGAAQDLCLPGRFLVLPLQARALWAGALRLLGRSQQVSSPRPLLVWGVAGTCHLTHSPLSLPLTKASHSRNHCMLMQ